MKAIIMSSPIFNFSRLSKINGVTDGTREYRIYAAEFMISSKYKKQGTLPPNLVLILYCSNFEGKNGVEDMVDSTRAGLAGTVSLKYPFRDSLPTFQDWDHESAKMKPIRHTSCHSGFLPNNIGKVWICRCRRVYSSTFDASTCSIGSYLNSRRVARFTLFSFSDKV